MLSKNFFSNDKHQSLLLDKPEELTFRANMSCPLQNLKPEKRITTVVLTTASEKSYLAW